MVDHFVETCVEFISDIFNNKVNDSAPVEIKLTRVDS